MEACSRAGRAELRCEEYLYGYGVKDETVVYLKKTPERHLGRFLVLGWCRYRLQVPKLLWICVGEQGEAGTAQHAERRTHCCASVSA